MAGPMSCSVHEADVPRLALEFTQCGVCRSRSVGKDFHRFTASEDTSRLKSVPAHPGQVIPNKARLPQLGCPTNVVAWHAFALRETLGDLHAPFGWRSCRPVVCFGLCRAQCGARTGATGNPKTPRAELIALCGRRLIRLSVGGHDDV